MFILDTKNPPRTTDKNSELLDPLPVYIEHDEVHYKCKPGFEFKDHEINVTSEFIHIDDPEHDEWTVPLIPGCEPRK